MERDSHDFQTMEVHCDQPKTSLNEMQSVQLLYAHQQAPLVSPQFGHLAEQKLVDLLQKYGTIMQLKYMVQKRGQCFPATTVSHIIFLERDLKKSTQ